MTTIPAHTAQAEYSFSLQPGTFSLTGYVSENDSETQDGNLTFAVPQTAIVAATLAFDTVAPDDTVAATDTGAQAQPGSNPSVVLSAGAGTSPNQYLAAIPISSGLTHHEVQLAGQQLADIQSEEAAGGLYSFNVQLGDDGIQNGYDGQGVSRETIENARLVYTLQPPPSPAVILAKNPAATNVTPAALGSVEPGQDPLSGAITSDTAFGSGSGATFATSSKLALIGGMLTYTPGLVTPAQAGPDSISYTVTDTLTGAAALETQTVTLDDGPAPTVAELAGVTAANGAHTTLGTATAGFGDDPIAVRLTGDATFGAGAGAGFSSSSSLSLGAGGALLYTPGPIASSNAGQDYLSYAVTDVRTGAVATEQQSIGLAAPRTTATQTTVALDGWNNIVQGAAVAIADNGHTGPQIDGPAGGDGTVSGTAAGEVIVAHGYFNTIDGGGGGDTIDAGLGLATVIVGDADADVTVTGGKGNTTVTLGNGRETLSLGGLGNAATLGSGLGSTIALGDGQSTLSVAGGSATITASGYFNAYAFDGGQITLQGQALFSTVVLSAGFGAGGSLDLAGTGDDTFNQSGGVLTVTNPGGVTVATIRGAPGGDVYLKGADGHGGTLVTEGSPSQVVAPTVITETQGNQTLAITASTTTVHLAGYIDTLTATGDGNHTVDGALGLTSVTPGNGDQNVTTSGTQEKVAVGNGTSSITGPQGDSVVSTGTGTETVLLAGSNNAVNIGGNGSTPDASNLFSYVDGGQGNDTVTSGSGNNVILAGGYIDKVTVLGDGTNYVFGSGAFTAAEPGDTLPNDPAGAEQSQGLATVTLGTGHNYVYLHGWNNVTHGTGGTDAIQGGAGDDTYAIDAPGGMTFISNFALANGDVLDVSGLFHSLGTVDPLGEVTVYSAMMASPLQPMSAATAGTMLAIPGQGNGAATSIFLADTSVQFVGDMLAHGGLRV